MSYNNRGISYVSKGRYTPAIADFDRAIEINPRYAKAYTNRGNVYWHRGQYDQAVSDYNKALSINPRDAVTYNNRGILNSLRSSAWSSGNGSDA